MKKYIELFQPSLLDLRLYQLYKKIDKNNIKEINAHAMDFLNLFALVAVVILGFNL